MNIKPIKSAADYDLALARLEAIFDAPSNAMEGDEAEILVLLIEDYENQQYFIEAPDPIEAIKIRLEELNLRQTDLVGIIGGKSRVSELLSRKRKLTLEMIRNLAEKLKLPISALVKDYSLAA